MAWVYILQTSSGKYYVGSTENLSRRIKQHDYGQTFTTKRLGVEKIVLAQEYPTMREARSVERQIKKLRRRDYIEKMITERYIRVKPR